MQFSVGDVVSLIPFHFHKMTVVEVDVRGIICRWFEGAAVKDGTFPALHYQGTPSSDSRDGLRPICCLS
jgi:uncharacterized protein YodC (DUF2158 family)